MDSVLAIRPFIPAKDFAVSKRYYQALGFGLTHDDAEIALLKMDSFSFILQAFYRQELAENLMVQMLVRDADAWWADHRPEALVTDYAVREPLPPALQPWGMKVGFVFDPSGVLWHVAEVPF